MPLLESSHSHGDVADMRRIRDTILYGEILSESTRGERYRLLTVSLFAMAASVLEFTPGVVKLAEGLSFQPPARWLFDIIVAAVLGYYTLIFGISANRDRRHWGTKIDEGLSSVRDALSAEGGRLLAEEIALEREQKSCDELKSACKDLEDEITQANANLPVFDVSGDYQDYMLRRQSSESHIAPVKELYYALLLESGLQENKINSQKHIIEMHKSINSWLSELDVPNFSIALSQLFVFALFPLAFALIALLTVLFHLGSILFR